MNANDPAFPRTGYYPPTDGCDGDYDAICERLPTMTKPTNGISVRDWLAAKALAGLLAGDASTEDGFFIANGGLCRSAAVYADLAYELADAMIAASRKPVGG